MLKTKFVLSSALIVENLHGEEEYPVSLMKVELTQVGANTVIIKAYAVNQSQTVEMLKEARIGGYSIIGEFGNIDTSTLTDYI